MPADPAPEPDNDLIAYLDGELDDAAAEKVEAELARDPAARARADEYKKSFDLLDYLPRPEPSPTFATRTLTRLQPVVGASGSRVAAPPRRKVWPEVLAWAVLTAVVAGAAFAGHHEWRQATDPKAADDLPISDLAVIESLPLYAGTDDLEFVRDLWQAGLFEADPADAEPPRREALSPADRDRLIEQFRAFTPARQQQLRTLHQKLSDPATPDRPALLRTLDGYAVWLARLSEADRRRVLDAPPEDRLEAVRQVREKWWRDGLPQTRKEALGHTADPEEKQALRQAYRGQEEARRAEWEFAQRQWKEMTGKDKPWPFSDPALAPQVDAYIQSAFGIDPTNLPTADKDKKPERVELKPECRLTQQEVIELRERREAATQSGYWFTYGALLLRLADKYPTLPRPRAGEPVVRPDQLKGKGYPLPKEAVRVGALRGKWPDFALEVVRVTKESKEAKAEPLGPCRPDDFPEPVKQFVLTKLTDQDRKGLDKHLGKWPDYPQEVLKLAREKNLSVPEVTLPGEPDKWRQYYQITPGKK